MKLISLVLGTAIAAVAPKPVDGVIPCMLKMVTEIDTCATKVAEMVECHDGGPDFAPAVCFREMVTCFSDGMQNFAQCLEAGTATASVAPNPVDGVLPCVLKVVADIGTCAIKEAEMAVCDEFSPEFAPRECYRNMVTCFVDGMINVAQCVEVNEVVLGTAIAPKPVDGVIPCMLKIAAEIAACEVKVSEMAVCDGEGPDFDPRLCYREMITCFVNGVLQVGDCLEVNEKELEQTSPKGNGFIVCFYNMAVQIEACEEKVDKMPECDEQSPDFAPGACLNELTTCMVGGIAGFRQCIE